MANVFALRDSSLNPFLFSEVGTQGSGNSVTILSLLARLGKDPWDEAAAWSRKPKDAAIEFLADIISKMPSNQRTFDDARLTAVRLAALLPNHHTLRGAAALPSSLGAIHPANLSVFFCFMLFLVFNLWMTLAPGPDAAATPATHAVAASPPPAQQSPAQHSRDLRFYPPLTDRRVTACRSNMKRVQTMIWAGLLPPSSASNPRLDCFGLSQRTTRSLAVEDRP